MPEKEGAFFSRHSQRFDRDTFAAHHPEEGDDESQEYPGITERGVELARERAEELSEIVDSAEKNAVIFIGGASEEERTASTAEVYGDALAERYKESDDVRVLAKSDIEELRRHARETKGKALDAVEKIISDNPDKKVVVDYPLFLKGLSLRPGFRDPETGARTDFNKAIAEQAGDDPNEALKLWIESNGEIEYGGKILHGPKPVEVAENHLRDIRRLREFAKKTAPDRPVVVGIAGHGWNLDALAIYLANKGEVTVEGFEKFSSKGIGQPEVGKVRITADGAVFEYRGVSYPVTDEVIEQI